MARFTRRTSSSRRSTISTTLSLFLVFLVAHVTAQAPVPLISQRFDWNNLPLNVYPYDYNETRERQIGENRCNGTALAQYSLCQTAVINSIDDFCLWGGPDPNSTVAKSKARMMAWCTTNKYGARVIPEGALKGVQFIRAPSYVQVTGRIDQTLIELTADDPGGELDPFGDDGRGNPVGGLVFSTAFSGANGSASGAYQQVIYYHNFMGGNVFCLKACNPTADNQASLCEHVYDRTGCAYNAPAAYTDGTFETCLGDDQLPPGVYVGDNGQTSTYTQPPESLGPTTSLPYVAAIPATSSCTSVNSAAIYTAGFALASSLASQASRYSSLVSVSEASVSSVSAVGASASTASVPGSGASAGAARTSSVPSATSTIQISGAAEIRAGQIASWSAFVLFSIVVAHA